MRSPAADGGAAADRPGARTALRARAAAGRVASSLPAVLQVSAAATLGYVLARYGLGHPTPIFSSTVALTALGFARDARPSRVAETALAIVLGIVLADLILLATGRGWWQLFVVLVVTFLIARFASPSPGFAAAAGVQSALVALFPVSNGNEFARVLDGAVGGVVALVVTALLPRDPMREVVREAHRVFAECTDAAVALALALRGGSEPTAEHALERLRATQPMLDAWTGSLDSALAVARISPLLLRRRARLMRQRQVLRGMDLACRDLRVLARRVVYLLPDGKPRPELAELMAEVAAAIALLAASLEDESSAGGTRDRLVVLAARLDPEHAMLTEAGLTESTVLVLFRPLVVDLLAATGMPEGEARALLPVLD